VELCPKNVNCSSKGMEAIASSKIVQDLYTKYPAYIHEYVGDDKSSTKNVLRHSWQDKMERRMREDAMRYKNNKKQWTMDNALLPINNPLIL
jgi:hypothetical protein